MGDVLSNQTLDVQDSDEGVGADVTAVGNIVSATGQNAYLNFQNDQSVAAHVEATVDGTVKGDAGPYFATTASATGNSATAGTCCALTEGSSLQNIESGAVVAGDAISNVASTASASVDASAVGNTTGWEQFNGEVQSWTDQTNSGQTTATNTGTITASSGNIGLSTTAVANNVTVDSDGATLDVGVQQLTDGPSTDSVVNLTIGSGTDLQATATGVGNNVDAQARGADASMNTAQTNNAPVNTYSNIEITNWTGDASVTAYGVGNSVVLANNGPRAGLFSELSSNGEINSAAAFTGGAGGAVFANATAIGNAVSGYACAACGGVIDANNSQIGQARVRANSAVVITGRARQVGGQANAIGNSATYQVFSADE
jgi:hypothetical protein